MKNIANDFLEIKIKQEKILNELKSEGAEIIYESDNQIGIKAAVGFGDFLLERSNQYIFTTTFGLDMQFAVGSLHSYNDIYNYMEKCTDNFDFESYGPLTKLDINCRKNKYLNESPKVKLNK